MRRPAALISLVFSLIPAVASATPPAPSAPPHATAAPHPSAPHGTPSAPAPASTFHVAVPTPESIHIAPATTHVTPATIHVTPAAVAESTPVVIPAYKPPPAGADTATILAAGRELLVRQAARTKSMLPTSGYATLEEVGQKVAAMGPQRAAVVDLLKSEEKLEFTMRVKSVNRDGVAQRGFLNQFDVGKSGGMLSPEYRSMAESSFLGISRTEYDQLPNSIRPKYGYLRPAKETGVVLPVDVASHYGEDIFVFKHDAVKDYVTVYPTDSLSQSAGTAPPIAWYHVMLPWADRMLLAPQMEVTPDGHQLKISGGAPPPGFQPRPGASYSTYLEMQIWRPIGLSDVERFEFATVPPSGEFLKALRSNGVKVFQIGQPAEWHGDAPAAPTSFLFFSSSSLAKAA